MYKTQVYPHHRRYKEISRILQQPVFIGLGQTTSWNIEAYPPSLDPNITTIPELFGYIQGTASSAHRVSNNSGGSDTIKEIDGAFYQIDNATTVAELQSYSTNYMYIEAVLDHNLIFVNDFRMLGVYTDITLASGSDFDTASLYNIGEVTEATLLYAQAFRAVYKQVNYIQTLRVVVEV